MRFVGIGEQAGSVQAIERERGGVYLSTPPLRFLQAILMPRVQKGQGRRIAVGPADFVGGLRVTPIMQSIAKPLA